MRTSYLCVVLLGLSLTGCTNTKTIDHAISAPLTPIKKQVTVSKTIPIKVKDPIAVAFYKKGQQPHLPYKVLGTETISKFNLAGVKRQEANIQDAMRNVAASMGGDAIINIVRGDDSVFGTVIAYQDADEKEIRGPLSNKG